MDNKVKEEMDEVIAELQKFTSRILDWREPVNPVLIERFEATFGVKLPEDYKYLLSITNGFSLMGDNLIKKRIMTYLCVIILNTLK